MLRRISSFILASLILIQGIAFSQEISEYEVKAAFVLNFLRFTEFPATAINSTGYDLCVVGDSVTTAPFRQVDGKRAQERPVNVHLLSAINQRSLCTLIFVTRSSNRTAQETMSALSGRPVLTIGEDELFLEAGGLVNFFIEENKIRFAINPKRAEALGIRFSSKLLALAQIYEE